MNSAEHNEAEAAWDTTAEPFNAVIVYENEAALKRALPIFQRLIHEFGTQSEFKCIWVSYDNLETASVADDAAEHSVIADMVIFSAQSGELPLQVRDWVERWLPRKNLNDSALAALVGSTEDKQVPPALLYLKSVAARADMEFLSEFQLSADSPAPTGTVLPNAVGWQAPAPQHWGINE